MLVGPDGEPIPQPRPVVEPSPPPPPPARPASGTVGQQVTKTQALVHQYSSTIRVDTTEIALANELNDTAEAQLYTSERAQTEKDLTAANIKLKILQAAQKAPTTYKEGPPPATVSNPVTKAVKPQLTHAQGASASATSAVSADQAAEAKTQARINAVVDSGDYNVHYVEGLEAQYKQEQGKLTTDTRARTKANAQLSADQTVVYGQQVKGDYSTLHKEGVMTVTAQGQFALTVPAGKLTPTELKQYDQFNAYVGAYGHFYQQTQLYVSDPKDYGNAGTSALNTVRSALSTLSEWQQPVQGMWDPPALKASTAKVALQQANRAAQMDYSAYYLDTTQASYQKALTLADSDPTGANLLTAAKDRGAMDQAVGYEGILYYQNVTQPHDQAAVTAARKAWDKNPYSATHANALSQAEFTQQEDSQEYQVAMTQLESGSVETAAADSPSGLALANAQASYTALNAKVNPPGVCVAVSPALQKSFDNSKTALTNAQDNPLQALSSWFQEYTWNATVSQAQWMYQNDPQSFPLQVPAGTSPADVKSWLRNEVNGSQVALARDTFDIDQPSNIVNPRSQADANTSTQTWDQYITGLHLPETNETTADQFADPSLAPGQKVDADEGLTELYQDQNAEQQQLDNRSWMQEAWDSMPWSNPDTGTSDYLSTRITQLQKLMSNEDNMSAAQFNNQYESIMANVSTQFDTQLQSQESDSQTWSQAEQAVTQVAAVAVAAGVTMATGGLGAVVAVGLGTAAGMVFSQGATALQNYSTVSQGGDLSQNPGVSILTVWTGNYGHGGVTSAQISQAYNGLEVDAINSFGASFGASLGGALADVAGDSVIPSVLTKVGLADVPEGVTGDLATNIMTSNPVSKVALYGARGATFAFGNQLVMSPAQQLATRVQVGYDESPQTVGWGDHITVAQGNQEIAQSNRSAVFNLITSPVAGWIGGENEADSGFLSQVGTDAAVNVALTYGGQWAAGQSMNSQAWTSAGTNTVLQVIGALGRQGGHASPSSATDDGDGEVETDAGTTEVRPQGAAPDSRTEAELPTRAAAGGGGTGGPPVGRLPTGGTSPDPDEPEVPGESGEENGETNLVPANEVLAGETEASPDAGKPSSAAPDGAAAPAEEAAPGVVVDLSKAPKAGRGKRGLIANSLLIGKFRKEATGTAVSPTVQAVTVLAAVGAGVALRDLAHLPELIDVLGGAGATFLSQMRSWSTRIAYFRVAQSGLKALYRAASGDADGAVAAIDLLAKRASFPYGIDKKSLTTIQDPDDPDSYIVVTAFQKKLTETKATLTRFANAVATYNDHVNDPSLPYHDSPELEQLQRDYNVYVPNEAQVKGQVAPKMPALPPGKLVRLALESAGNIDFLLDGASYNSSEQLSDIVSRYRAVEDQAQEDPTLAETLDGWQRVENLESSDPDGMNRMTAALNAEHAYRALSATVDEVLNEWQARSGTAASLDQWRAYHRVFSLAFGDDTQEAASLIHESFPQGATEGISFDDAMTAADLGNRLGQGFADYETALDELTALTPDSSSRRQEINAAYPIHIDVQGDPHTADEARLALYWLRDMAPGSLLSDADRAALMPDGADGPSDWLQATDDAYKAVEANPDYNEWTRVSRLVSRAGAAPELPRQLLTALDAEDAHHTLEGMINDKGNTIIDSVGVQNVLGSSMHITHWWGRLFKFGALDFTENSGVEAVREMFDDRGGAWTTEVVDSGEVVGNDPNAMTQWNYQRTLYDREKHGSKGITEYQVNAYLNNRLHRMIRAQRRWAGFGSLLQKFWGGTARLERAQAARNADGAFLESQRNAAVTRAAGHEAELNGLPDESSPAMTQEFININLTKYILSRIDHANTRIKTLESATDAATPFSDKVAVAKAEAAMASKSMNTAGDYMSIPSVYRYAIKGVSMLSGEPTVAGITLFHGLVSNTEWLRAQQGAPVSKIWGVIPTSPTGIEAGKGLFFSKVFGRGYNSVLSAVGGDTDGTVRYSVTHFLMLEEGDVAARNRARKLLLVTALVVPVMGVLLAYVPVVKNLSSIGGSHPGGGSSQSKPVAPGVPGSGSGTQPGHSGGSSHKKPTPETQYVVLPLDGLNVRSQPSDTGTVTGEFQQGEFVVSTGDVTKEADGIRWIKVSGGGQSGWVDEQDLGSHAAGSEGATGRDDPTLAREGYKSVVVASGETLSQIAAESRVNLSQLLRLDDSYLLNPNEIYPGDRIYIPRAS